MITLKEQILQELNEAVGKKNAILKELEEAVRSEMFLKSTVTGGLFADAARNACEARADAARRKISSVKAGMAWQEEMIKKYKQK